MIFVVLLLSSGRFAAAMSDIAAAVADFLKFLGVEPGSEEEFSSS